MTQLYKTKASAVIQTLLQSARNVGRRTALVFALFLFASSGLWAQNVSVISTGAPAADASYATVSAAFAAINAGTHQGRVSVVIDANTTEPNAPTALADSGVGAARYNSVIMYPSADNVVITVGTSFANNRGIIELNSADNVTIDGDNPNSVGINRNLTIAFPATGITTTNVVANIRIISGITATDNAANRALAWQNISIKNLRFEGFYGSTLSNGSMGIVTTGATWSLFSANSFCSNLEISNNLFLRGHRAIYTYSSTTYLARMLNVKISNNQIGLSSSTAATLGSNTGNSNPYQGMYLYYADNMLVENNTFDLISAATGTHYAVYMGAGTTTSAANIVFKGNTLNRYWANSSGAVGVTMYGFFFFGDNINIINNKVSNMRGVTSTLTTTLMSTSPVFGLYLSSGTGVKIYNNTVNMYGAPMNTSTTNCYSGSAIYASAFSVGQDIRNNIFINKMSHNSGVTSATLGRFAAFFHSSESATSPTGTTINNNYYGVTQSSAQHFVAVAGTGTAGTTRTLAQFTTQSRVWTGANATNNGSSGAGAPLSFTADNNLTFASAPTEISDLGANVSANVLGFNIDSRGVTRSSTPDMGAEEYTGSADATAPTFSGTTLANHTGGPSRDVTVTISDAASKATNFGPNAARLYYRKVGGAVWFSALGTNTAGNSWTFTINYPSLGGVAVDDVIEYFFAASDLQGNIGFSPSIGFESRPTSTMISDADGITPSGNFTIIAEPKSVGADPVATQVLTGGVGRSSTNNAVLRLQFLTNGNSGNLYLQTINVAVPAGVTASNITNVKLFAGVANSFASATQIGTTRTLSGGAASFTSLNYDMPQGTSYIWVTADISSSASPYGSPIDLQISAGGITIDGTDYSPSSPAGAGEIAALFNFETSGTPFINVDELTVNSVTGTVYDWSLSNMPASGITPYSLNTGFSTVGLAYPGVRSGSTGSRVWGTNPTNTPTPNTTTSVAGSHDIFTQPLTATGNVTFNFWNWWSLESATTAYDNVFYFYRINGGAWVATSVTSSGLNMVANWSNRIITVPSVAGNTVELRMSYEGDAPVYAGYFFDDMLISGIVVDEVLPVITTNTVANTTATGDRTLTAIANITDNGSINTTAGTKPRIYYKKSSQANDSTNWKFTETTSNTGADFDFTILRSKFDTLYAGETVQYFVVAQDNGIIANVGGTAGLTFNSTPTSVNLRAANFPVSGAGIKSYDIINGPRIFGDVTIDQPSASILSTNPNLSNVALVRIKVNVLGTLGTIYLNKLVANLTGNITASQISRVRLNTTGTNPLFVNPTIIGANAQNFSGGTVTFNAANSGTPWPYQLNAGTNYLWLTVNVASNATPGSVIDATISEISVSRTAGTDSLRTIATPNPTGNLTVLNSFTFESGAQGFTNASTNTLNWVFTEMPAAGTSPNSLNTTFFSGYNSYPGPRVGSTGTKIWGTNPVNTPSGVTGAAYDVPAYGNMDLNSAPFVASGPTVVTFYEWYACYFTQYQHVRIQYTTNNGTNWTTVATVTGQITPNAWFQRTINIPSVANDVVRVRWQYSSYFVYQPGYFFDDFVINAPQVADNTPPTISLATVDNTPSRANRTILGLATITDPTPGYGVNGSATLRPRLYYRRQSDPSTSASAWKSVAANNSTSPFNFTVDYSALTGGTGVVVGDRLQYFVVAQDDAPTPNVRVSPGVSVAGGVTSVNLTTTNLQGVTGTLPYYEFINGPLTLDSVFVTHPTNSAVRGTSNQILSRVELQVGGSLNSLNLTSLVVNSNSANMTTTNVGNIRLFYTTGTTFSSATQIGATATLTGSGTTATITFNGFTRALIGGSNYIWVASDIPAGATIGTTLDVSQAANSITVNNGTTTTTAPLLAKVPGGVVTVTLPLLPNLAYTVTRSTGIEYTSIVGMEGTSTFGFTAGSSRDDAMSPNIDLSTLFTGFVFQGETLTRIGISTNGHLQFNNDFTTTNSLSNTSALRKAFVPLNDDLYCSTTDPNNHHFWRVDGTPGNRVFTAEWFSMERYTNTGPDLNFQVKLYENGDRIEFVYGTMVGFNGTLNTIYSYTMGIFGGVTGVAQTTTTPLAGQYLSQRFENTNNFQNNTFEANLQAMPTCNSRITFTPSASFTNGTANQTVVSNTFCGAATPINLTFGATIDNCNVYKTALYSGVNTTPAICTTGVAGGADDAAWFSFYNDSPRDIVVLVNGSGNFAPAIQLASSCSNALACTTTTTTGLNLTLSYPALPVGTYYVRVHHNGLGVGNNGEFTMSVYTTASPPANDICSGATTLTPNATETLGNTLNTTSQANSPAGVGLGVDPDDDDVWYKFTATTTSATILSRGVSPFVPVVEVWRTACPDNLTATTERLLQSNPGVASQQSNLLTGLTVGTTYYIRVYHRATGAPASGSRQFYLQVSLPRPACPTVVNRASAPAANIINTPGLGGRASTNVSYDSSTVYTWNRITFDGTISYRYYFGNNAAPTDGLFTTTSDTTVITPALADGATYYFQVRTVSSTNGESINCGTSSFTTKVRPGVPVCAVVSSPAANAVTTVTPTITWASVTNTFRYTVEVSTVANFATSVYSNTNVGSGTTSLTIPSGTLAGNTTYFVRVTPRNASGVAPTVTCNSVTFRTEVANNNASSAIALTVASSCSSTNATSTGASASSVSNGVGVSGANDDDVWFSFVPTTQNVTISVTGGTTAGTLQNPVIELALSNGSIISTFDGSTGATEIGSGNVPFVDGRSYLVRVYSRSTNVSNAGTFSICVIGSTALTGNNTISGTYGSITVASGNTLTINGTTTVGNLTVENGATLVVEGNNVVSGNTFTLAAGANLQIGSTVGISSSTATGNIQFAVRNFSTDANYVYNGSAAQVTGAGLPTRVRNLTINNTNGVALTSNTSVAEVLNIAAGTFACGINNLTFLSSATTTARLAQLAGGAAITGSNFTVERNAGAYNGSANTATGAYYFLGTPVTGATLTDWSVAGRFSQVFTGLTRSTYTYNATTGWASGAATTAMNPGTGAQIWADQSLQRNNVPFSINGSGITTGNVDITDNAANTTTFKLVANPYPSPIDFGSVRSASTNIDNTFWVWSHVNRSYMVVTNGNSSIPVGSGGLTNVLASSQGFFVKATAAGAYSVNIREAHKTTTSSALGRVATNGTVRMSINSGSVTSFAAVVLNNEATSSFDSEFDGQLLPGAVNISTVTTESDRLSINSLPVPTVNETVGINITSNTAGVHNIAFSELSNLPSGMRVFLQDRTNGTLTEISAGFTFQVTLEANANTDRFSLVFAPASVNNASSKLGQELVSVFPNPATSGNFTVRTSGFTTEKATIIITDAVGKTVHTQNIQVGLTPVNSVVNTKIAAGVYNVTCISGNSRITTKLVVNK